MQPSYAFKMQGSDGKEKDRRKYVNLIFYYVAFGVQVHFFGPGGSGKSTFSWLLSARTGISCVITNPPPRKNLS